MAKQKKPWGTIVLVAFVGFCVLPILLWFGAITKGNRDYEASRDKWEQVFIGLVEQQATIEEVKETIRANGKEPFVQEPHKGIGREFAVGVFGNDIEQYWFVQRMFSLFIEFDEEGRAATYELHDGGVAL